MCRVGYRYAPRLSAFQLGHLGEGVLGGVVVLLVHDTVVVGIAEGAVVVVVVAGVGDTVAVGVGDAAAGEGADVAHHDFAADVVVTEPGFAGEEVGAYLVEGLFFEAVDGEIGAGEMVVKFPVVFRAAEGFDGHEVAQRVVAEGGSVEMEGEEVGAGAGYGHVLGVVAVGGARRQFHLERPGFGAGAGEVHVGAVAELLYVHFVGAALAQVIDGHFIFVVYQLLLPFGSIGGQGIAGRHGGEAVAHEQAPACGRQVARG